MYVDELTNKWTSDDEFPNSVFNNVAELLESFIRGKIDDVISAAILILNNYKIRPQIFEAPSG